MKYAEPTLTNLKDEVVLPVVHGENFLMPVDKAPEGKWVKYDKMIFGHSESGHNHLFDGEVEVLEAPNMDSGMFVRLLNVTNVVHHKTTEIHETVTHQPGIYRITHKTEYDPFAKVVRRVFD